MGNFRHERQKQQSSSRNAILRKLKSYDIKNNRINSRKLDKTMMKMSAQTNFISLFFERKRKLLTRNNNF